ncbi:MAG TPA: CbiX/SirB N-terminal domain-containing protein [Burkholderiaceae bacterium]|jgi:sirohydrochlorin cobaltochelatase|nr:CbiX/SirB N-terminal domain-containing protein [Burkholderiaceae bacterium]
MGTAGADALVLFAHGARDARWSQSLRALETQVRARAAQASVRTAFLELQTPTLLEALEAAAGEGALRIHIVPVFWAGAGHVENDLPPILAAFSARYPQVAVRALPVLSELPGMLDFIARTVADTLSPAPLPRSGRGEF